MNVVIRTLLVAGVALLPAAGLGQQRQAAAARLDAVASFLDGQTVAVGHLDLAKLDIKATLDFFTKDDSADLLKREQLAEVVAKGTDVRDKLVQAGCSDVFVIVSLADVPPAEPLIVLPLAQGGNADAVAEVVRSLGRGPEIETIRGAVVLSGPRTLERVRTMKALARPDLAKALESAGDSPLRVAVSPAEDTRRALRESLPEMPAELGGMTGAELMDSFGSLTLAARLPPRPSLSLSLQAKDAQAARKLNDLANRILDQLAQDENLQRQLPPIRQLIGLLKPQVQGDQLVLKLDEEQGTITKIVDEVVKPAIASARASATRMQSSNNLKQLMLAMHNYHDTFTTFPPRASRKDDKRLLSWRVHLLPFLEEKDLYDQFHLDEPWDSEHNQKLIEKMPRSFAGQGLTDEQVKKGMTNYLVPVGPKTVFEGDAGISLAKIADGTSNTIAIVEAAPEHAVEWTKPDDWRVDFSKPFAGLLAKPEEGKPPQPGFNAAFCDGSVRFIARTIDWELMRKLLQKDDGEVVGEF